ncbi:transposase [Colwellia sp. C2M11]|uniref:transposase n=1 Tax=unclassified Colwellia TaxID=196834 RepID=UPI001C082174|nr:transposase [Colwellia sp. C2M11]
MTPKAIVLLYSYFSILKGKPTGIKFIDSTSIKVCNNFRIARHKKFGGITDHHAPNELTCRLSALLNKENKLPLALMR